MITKKQFLVLLSTLLWCSPALASSAPPATHDAPDAAVAGLEADTDEEEDEELLAQATEGVGADAQLVSEAQDEADEPLDEKLLPIDLRGSVRLNSTLGHLVRSSTEARSGMSAILGLNLSYGITDLISASATITHVQFLSRFGGSTRRYEGRFQDIQLAVSHSSLVRDDWSGLNLSGSLSGSIPTSESSRFTDKFTTLSATGVLSRRFGDFSLSLSQSFSKNFHRYTSTVADLDRYGVDAIARADSPEQIAESLVALQTGLLPSHSLSTQLSASYNWFSGFSTSLSFGLANSWTYSNGTITEEDEFTNENARVGRGFRQVMTGSISANYRVNQHLSFAASMSTNQPPRTADNSSLRFPFYDTQSGNLQYTSLSLGVTGSY